jgi:serine/threonine-protein kinase HipA
MSDKRDIQELGAIQEADVFKGVHLSAHLTRTEGGVKFEYTPEYLASDLPQIAHTLPKTDEPQLVAAGGVPSFFAGLLPEGRRLQVLQRAIKTSADDELSLLLAIGEDVVGDVKVVPHGDSPSPAKPLVEVQKTFEEIKFSDLINEFAKIDKIGIPGVQEKVSAKRIWLPASRAGSQYILKLESPEYSYVIENEEYFLSIARKTIKEVVQSELVHDSDGKSGLLVTRFDRTLDNFRSPISLPVEDACQVLNRWPADKYNMSSEKIIHEVSKICSSKKLAARELYRQFCFAWLTGNGDLHAKNISILSSLDGEWRVSPAYDLPSTVFYGDRTLALEIGGKKSGHSRRSLIEFGVNVGLPEKVATKVLDETLEATSQVIHDLNAGLLPFNNQIISDSVAVLRHRSRTASPSQPIKTAPLLN